MNGAPRTSGTETVNLSVPIGTATTSTRLVFNRDPVVFTVANTVGDASMTSSVSEQNYTGAFMLTQDPV